MLSDAVADQIAMFRKARGWNTERLAEECSKIGLSDLTAAVLRNIESGRRNPQGVRRRTVSVDELMGLAQALKVPPTFLLIPYPEHETVDFIPGEDAPTWLMHHLVFWYSYNSSSKFDDDVPAAFQIAVIRAREATRSLTEHNDLMYRRGLLASRTANAHQRLTDEKITRDELHHLQASLSNLLANIETTDVEIISLRQEMGRHGFPLPPLPPELEFLADITEEEYQREYTISVGVNGLSAARTPGLDEYLPIDYLPTKKGER